MSKIVIRSFAEAPRLDQHRGIELRGGAVYGLLTEAPGELEARLLKMEAGDIVRWTKTVQGFVVYVLAGAIQVQGIPVGADGAIIIEHGAAAEGVCLEASTQLLVFNRSEKHAGKPMRAGGHVHILPTDAVPRSRGNMALEESSDSKDFVGGSLYSDAACASCELWLHGNRFNAHHESKLHSHSEDEVIVVTEGAIILGNKSFGPGTTIAIAKDTVYGFRTGDAGLAFINFRPKSPTYKVARSDGPPVDERAAFLAHMPSPAYVEPRRIN